jgi:rubrerythrin
MDWKQFIQVMKIDERAAKAKYLTAAKAADNEAVRNIFNKLAYEEEMHLSVLEGFERDLKKVLAGEKVPS